MRKHRDIVPLEAVKTREKLDVEPSTLKKTTIGGNVLKRSESPGLGQRRDEARIPGRGDRTRCEPVHRHDRRPWTQHAAHLREEGRTIAKVTYALERNDRVDGRIGEREGGRAVGANERDIPMGTVAARGAVRKTKLKTVEIHTRHAQTVKSGKTKGGAADPAACVDHMLAGHERRKRSDPIDHAVERTIETRMIGEEIFASGTVAGMEKPEVEVASTISRAVQIDSGIVVVALDAGNMGIADHDERWYAIGAERHHGVRPT